MKKIEGYNRNLTSSGKRPHKKIQRFGKYQTLSERLKAETKALDEYQKRVGQTNVSLIKVSEIIKKYKK